MLADSVSSFASWSKLLGSGDDDYVDRVNHIYTVVVLVLFSIISSSGTYIGHGISCWTPIEVKYKDYVTNYCWTGRTYHIPMTHDLENTEKRVDIHYYLWIPMILLFQSFLFKAPNFIWQMLNKGNGMNVERLVALAEDTQMVSENKRAKVIDDMSNYIDRWIRANRQIRFGKMTCMRRTIGYFQMLTFSKREGTYMSSLYLLIKVLYCLNVVMQYYLLNALLRIDYKAYGWNLAREIAVNGTPAESLYFPRVTYCDFKIKQLKNTLPFTAQCILPINVLNEKMFAFLWFWFAIVAAMTIFNLLIWIYRMAARESYVSYIFKYLKRVGEGSSKSDKLRCKEFIERYLRNDGVMLLRVVAKNSTNLVVSDLVSNLWNLYKKKDEDIDNEKYTSSTTIV